MWIQLKVKEQLDPVRKKWFEDLTINGDAGRSTLLSGELPDQAALYGLLTKCSKLGLTLVSFDYSETGPVSEGDYFSHE